MPLQRIPTLSPLLLCLLTLQVMAQELRLSKMESSNGQEVAALILADVYQQAGLQFSLESMPAARATSTLRRGETDGEVGRVASYFAANPTFVKVEPAIYRMTSAAFSLRGKGIKIRTAEDLKHLRVGIVRGVAHVEAITANVTDLQVTNSFDSAYRMLDAGRFDVLLDTRFNGEYYVRKLQLKRVEHVGDLAKHELFHVLHPSRIELLPKLSRAISSLKKSGDLAKLTTKYEAQVLRSAQP